MLALYLLLDMIVGTIIGLAFTGGCAIGLVLRNRFLTIDYHTTTASTLITAHPPRPRFVDTCPLALPVQLRYSPLAATKLNEPLAIIGPYGFVPIASDYLHRLKHAPRCSPPQASPKHLQPLVRSEPRPVRTRIEGCLIRVALSTGRALRMLANTAFFFAFAALFASVCIVVTNCQELTANRREVLGDIQHHRDLHTKITHQTDENVRASDTLQNVASRLEQRVAECDRYRPAASSLGRYRRQAAFFEDTVVQLVETLAQLDTENVFGLDILENNDELPTQTVTNDTQARAPLAGVTPVAATCSRPE